MAPEQHRGEPCDARSDQFSFCVTFYAALYGERPFAGSSYEALRANILDGRVLAPPAGTTVPPWIRAIVLRGLAVDPDARWPSMAALLSALARDPAARRARVVGASAAAAVALVGAAVVGLAQQRRANAGVCHDPRARLAGVWDGARRDEVAAAFRATGAGYAARAFTSVATVFDDYASAWTAMVDDTCRPTTVRGPKSDELFDLRMACLENRRRDWKARVDVLGHADRATVEHAVEAAQSLDRLDACADPLTLRAAVPLPADRAARTRLEALRGRIAAAHATIEAGHFADARRLMPALVADARAAGYRPVEAEALSAQVELDERTDRYSDAANELKEMTAIAESVRDDDLAALGRIDQVWIIGTRLGRLAEGRELARSASAAIERLGENAALRARLEAHLGSLEINDGHTAEARAHVERALTLRRRVLRPDDPLLAETLRVLGDVAVMESKPDEAIGHYRAALQQLEQTLGPDHPTTGWVTSSLAAALRVKGELPEALAAYDRARAIVLRNSDASDALLATIALNVGMIDTELGRYDAASAQYAQASTIWTAALGADHPNLGSVHLLSGQLALRRHRLDEARSELMRAQQIFTKAFGAEHPSVAEALIGFGDLNLAANAPGEALGMYRRAASIQKKALGASYPDLAIPLTGMGLAELAQGDAVHARVELEQALALRQATPGDPVERARTELALARALRAAHGDAARARALALSARRDYAGRAGQEAALAEVDAFLR
jgi:tetratricopeptide (TPR) repeat protein